MTAVGRLSGYFLSLSAIMDITKFSLALYHCLEMGGIADGPYGQGELCVKYQFRNIVILSRRRRITLFSLLP
jgi:hypothetical protein